MERKTEILRLFNDGIGYTNIAKRFGISRQRAYQIIRGSNPKEASDLTDKIKNRDKYQCQSGKHKPGEHFYLSKLVVHHIDKNPSNNSESNLVTLCVDCHKRVDSTDKPVKDTMEYMTVNAFARKAGVSRATIDGHIQRGNIKTVWRKVKAIPVSELEKYTSVEKDDFGRRQVKAVHKTA